MPEMKTLGGYEVVDAKAREDIAGLSNNKLYILDIYNCTKLDNNFWQLTDNVKDIIKRLFNGESFPIAIAEYSHFLQIPTRVIVTSDKVEITLAASHGYSGNYLVSVNTTTYRFLDVYGRLQVENHIDRITTRDEWNALVARVEALEGGN